MHRVDAPFHEQSLATLPNHLNSLVQEKIVDQNEHGYKLNPLHPFHSRIVPDIDQIRMSAGTAGSSTDATRTVKPAPLTHKRKGRSRSRSKPVKAGRGRALSRSRNANKSTARKGRMGPGR